MSDVEPSPWWTDEELGPDELQTVIAPVLERLEAARDAGRMPRSLLLGGPERMGRERAAVELAALLTCPARSPAGCTCSSCRRVRSGVHPDVTAIRAHGKKGQIVIEQVRGIVEAAPGRPFEGMSRVWILEGVEANRFGREAANAFLKTLEEPPDHVRFILLAANPEAVLPTIRSRCQRLVLPGSAAMARLQDQAGTPVELLPAAAAGAAVAELVAAAKRGLEMAQGGEVLGLLRTARRLDPEPAGFQIAAMAAMEVAVEAGDGHAEGLVRLAADLLEAEKRHRALNLNRNRQILSCLLRWYAGAGLG
ncbi:MAG: hypothetical protein GXP48_07250 [Acidobacteria bacterium]|nr:hypothetical protein [Acidobacteriota bacterium]